MEINKVSLFFWGLIFLSTHLFPVFNNDNLDLSDFNAMSLSKKNAQINALKNELRFYESKFAEQDREQRPKFSFFSGFSNQDSELAHMQNLKKKLNRYEMGLYQDDTKAEVLNNKITTVFSFMKSKMTDLYDRIMGSVEKHDREINAHKTEIAFLKENINKLQSSILNADKNVDNKIAGIVNNDKTSTHKLIEAQKNATFALKNNVAQLQKEIFQTEQKINNKVEKIIQNKSNLARLHEVKSSEDQKRELAELKGTLTGLKKSVTSIENGLDGKISILAKQGDVQAEFARTHAREDRLESEIKELKHTAASHRDVQSLVSTVEKLTNNFIDKEEVDKRFTEIQEMLKPKKGKLKVLYQKMPQNILSDKKVAELVDNKIGLLENNIKKELAAKPMLSDKDIQKLVDNRIDLLEHSLKRDFAIQPVVSSKKLQQLVNNKIEPFTSKLKKELKSQSVIDKKNLKAIIDATVTTTENKIKKEMNAKINNLEKQIAQLSGGISKLSADHEKGISENNISQLIKKAVRKHSRSDEPVREKRVYEPRYAVRSRPMKKVYYYDEDEMDY